MIISCPNCKRKFIIEVSLIPAKGRHLQCGSCKYTWFYKVESKSSTTKELENDIANNEIKQDASDVQNIPKSDKNIIIEKTKIKKNKISAKNTFKTKKELTVYQDKNYTGNKFFSYLIVFFVTLIAIFILIDTFKSPLIDIFPKLENILFNLYETLKDIKLFIIDLF